MFKQQKYLVLILIVLFNVPVYPQDKSDLQTAILNTITTSAGYAAGVLLDENGKSKCDYNMLSGKWEDYEPLWHTGQIILALTRAYDLTRDETWLKSAKKAGDWWTGTEIKDFPKLKGMLRSIHGAGVNYIIFSTVTDGSAGLFRLYELTKEEKYAVIPTRAGDWMYANMWEPKSRMFYDAVDPKTGEVMKHWSPFWPEKQNQTLNDVARPNNEGSIYKDMYEFTGDEKYRKIFVEICESLVEKQGPEGLWMDFTPNDKADGSIHPRFNIWYAESLMEGYDLTGDKRYLDAALKTGRFYTKIQQKNGAFCYTNYLDGTNEPYSISGSTTAFAGILWLRLLKAGVGEEFKNNIELCLKWTLDNQYPADHPDKNLAGGILEIRAKAKNGKISIFNRDIATSFAIRFLADYYDYFLKD